MLDSRFALSRNPGELETFDDEKVYHRISPRFEQREEYAGSSSSLLAAESRESNQEQELAEEIPESAQLQGGELNFSAISASTMQILEENTNLMENKLLEGIQVVDNNKLPEELGDAADTVGLTVTPVEEIELLNQQNIEEESLISEYQRAMKKLTGEIRRLKNENGKESVLETLPELENVECETEIDMDVNSLSLMPENNKVSKPSNKSSHDSDNELQRGNEGSKERLISDTDNSLQPRIEEDSLLNDELLRENEELQDHISALEAKEKEEDDATSMIERLNSQLEATCNTHNEIVERLKNRIVALEQQAVSKPSDGDNYPPGPIFNYLLEHRFDPTESESMRQKMGAILLHCRNLQYYSVQEQKSCQYFSELVKYLYTKFWRYEREIIAGREALRNELSDVLSNIDSPLKKRLFDILSKY